MAYDQNLGSRVAQVLKNKKVEYEPREMMGGLCFMVDEKMCMGIVGEEIMARIGPDAYADALEKEGCKEMTFTGRPMKGFVYVEPDVIDEYEDLEYWVQLALDFNPLAKKSKKTKKKK